MTGIKDYQATKGNQGVLVLLRKREGHAEFFLLTLWESWDAIHRFAGEDVDKAFYKERARKPCSCMAGMNGSPSLALAWANAWKASGEEE